MQTIGYDLGSSSIKVSVIDTDTGECIASAFYPKEEMPISAPRSGWAEQDPEMWWKNALVATKQLFTNPAVNPEAIAAIGISYQMHGLVMVDKDLKPLRPSIIWCDSRAVETGERAFNAIGPEECLDSLLNSPGNFTASKLAWVKENEPGVYKRIYKIMLPGDYFAMKLTGEACITPSGLSEGIFWDFRKHEVSQVIMDHFGFDADFIPRVVPVFSTQGRLTAEAASLFGLKKGTPVTYRAGDQPNNAFSLNVLKPGEIAATAGTSGVVYGVSDEIKYDPQSRVNTFAHVNHEKNKTRVGVLLCINGTGILNSWVKRNVAGPGTDYNEMNRLAGTVAAGSDGVRILPFGNGSERMLGNRDTGCHIGNVNFNVHNRAHIIRAVQEGIVFAFRYGMDIMGKTGITPEMIRAGKANMFLSPIFATSLATLTGAGIELYNTDGSQGAARAAAIGAGIYFSFEEAFGQLKVVERIEPDGKIKPALEEAYAGWVELLNCQMQKGK
ncbi:MAG: carbohydrate kinase [Marinilabiliales bacterium]|nr:MAG: carbohydrate kinase [Marinilabiliales bacterium]